MSERIFCVSRDIDFLSLNERISVIKVIAEAHPAIQLAAKAEGAHGCFPETQAGGSCIAQPSSWVKREDWGPARAEVKVLWNRWQF